MNLKNKILPILLFALILFNFKTVYANTSEELEKRIEKLEKQADHHPDKFKIFGALEIDYSYADDADTSNAAVNGSTSDLDAGTVAIGIEAALHKYITAVAMLKGENLDSDNNVFWDEAFFKIQKEGFPVYLVAGKRVQPFGVFENQLINDPVTCELYEINDTGLTIGYAGKNMAELDFSITAYRGETLITKINDAGFGWTRDNTNGYSVTNDVDSFIISSRISPFEGTLLSAFFNSEPGDSSRNTSAGAALHAEIAGFVLSAEYISALQREKHVTDDQEYKEKAWVVSLGYQIIDPLIATARYESFDADKNAAENLENRYSFGGSYTLYEEGASICRLMGEYRKSKFETASGSANNDSVNEFFARIAIEF